MKNVIFLIMVIIVSSCVSNKNAEETNACKPVNVVFILADDLGWKDLGCYGSEYYETPKVNKLASEGMLFTDAYMMPTCAPSRAALMSGQYPPRTGIFSVDGFGRTPENVKQVKGINSEHDLKPEVITLAECLKTNGYTTGMFGKWHLGDDENTTPTAQGFDVNIAGGNAGRPNSYFSPFGNIDHIESKKDDYISDLVTQKACEFIEHNKANPFFVYLPFYLVHVPLHTKKEWVAKYSSKQASGLQSIPAYGAMVSHMDDCVGKVMEALKQAGVDDHTLVIFTSDNGGQNMVTSNEPLTGQKGNLSEGGIRVPLIVRWPGKVRAESSCNKPVTVVDYYPTVLDVTQTKAIQNHILDGESIVPLLTESGDLQRDAIFWHLPNYNGFGSFNAGLWQRPCGAIRKGDWKLIEDFESGSVYLYNLREDISERNNLANQNPEKRDELLARLKQWQKETNAPLPTEKNPDYKAELVPDVNPYINHRVLEETEKSILIK